MNPEILKEIKERGLLIEKDIFEILSGFESIRTTKKIIESLEIFSGQKIITKASLNKNYEFARKIVNDMPNFVREDVEKVFIKLGINLEIKKEKIISDSAEDLINLKREPEKKNFSEKYRVFYADTKPDKKITVQDFVGHFRARYKELQGILMQHFGLDNLTSINKISGSRQNITIIGIVNSKRKTKNNNLIITFEDLTGQISALVKATSDCFRQADELQLDDVVAVKCSGNNEMVFVHEVIYPEAHIPIKTKFEEDICVAFISDIHVGSHKFLQNEFEHFISWLNSDVELAKKIKYLFVVGDAVDGVGVFPGQERLLKIKTLKGQYNTYAEYIKKIPKEITIFQCPGQHDASRVLEPQPILNKTYAGALYDISNLTLVSNPCMVKLFEGDKEFKVLMYHGASIHSFINNIEELRLIKAHHNPAKAVKHMLKRRHLAPSHGVSASIVYVPNAEKDPLVISEVPDILCTGEVHRLDIEKHNGTLILTGSCWQARTEFEEKVGNIPDPCKVPVFNLKTHELRILDFTLDAKEEGR